MAFYKVDGRAEELTSWISLSYVCQGENLVLIFIELLLIRVQFETLLNQNKIKMKDKTWMEFMNQKVGFFYCILTTHLTVVLKGHLPLVVCLVVCYCFCNELVYIIKSRPSGESLLFFFKYYIIDKFLNWKYQILFCILFRPMRLLIKFFGLYHISIKCRTIWIL